MGSSPSASADQSQNDEDQPAQADSQMEPRPSQAISEVPSLPQTRQAPPGPAAARPSAPAVRPAGRPSVAPTQQGPRPPVAPAAARPLAPPPAPAPAPAPARVPPGPAPGPGPVPAPVAAVLREPQRSALSTEESASLGSDCSVHSDRRAHMFCKQCAKLACERCLEDVHFGHPLLTCDQAKRMLTADCRNLLNVTNGSIGKLEMKNRTEESVRKSGYVWTAKLGQQIDKMIMELRETKRNLEDTAKKSIDGHVATNVSHRNRDEIDNLMRRATGLQTQFTQTLESDSLNALLLAKERNTNEVEIVRKAADALPEANLSEMEAVLIRDTNLNNVENTRRVVRNLLLRSRKKGPVRRETELASRTGGDDNDARGVIVCVGGRDSAENELDSVEVYIPLRNEWVPITSMNFNRSDAAIVSYGNKVYVTGGRDSGEVFDTVEVYDPLGMVWELATEMKTARYGHSLVCLDRKIYAMGGHSGRATLNTVECYDTNEDTWKSILSLTTARHYAAAAAYKSKILVIAGALDQRVLSTCEAFDVNTEQWKPFASVNQARIQAGAAAFRNRVYLFGGSSDYALTSVLDSVEEYDDVANKWTRMALRMPIARRAFGTCIMNNRIYIVGGHGNWYCVDTAAVFDPADQKFSEIASMLQPRDCVAVTYCEAYSQAFLRVAAEPLD